MDDLPLSDAADPDSQPISSASISPLPDSELQAYIEKYPFAAEPTYFTRPNRYYGPASTWRSWTANDRAVAEDALNNSRASDLGAHLYNAFALKEKANSARAGRPGVRSHSRSRPRSTGDDHSEVPFAPPDVWTAWPLRARDVSRENASDGFKRTHLTVHNNDRPSAALEETLVATILRTAKEKWSDRLWEPEKPRVDRAKRDWKAEIDLTKQQLRESGLLDDEGEDVKLSRHEIEGRDTEGVDDVSVVDDSSLASSPEANIPTDVPTFSSQAFAAAAASSSSEDESEASVTDDDRPVFSADDEEARRVLLPSTRHLLSKVDDLLVGLHKARVAYAVRDHGSQPRSRSATSGAATTDDERFTRFGSRAASRKRGRKRKRSHSSREDDSGCETTKSRSRTRSAFRQFGTKGKGYGLRDWSDVLGMAALTGWKTETIARASERCAKLFGQNMVFRTFYEGDDGAHNQAHQEPYFEEEIAYVPSEVHDKLSTMAHNIQSPNKDLPDIRQDVEYIRAPPPCDRCRRQGLRCAPSNSLEDFDSTTPVTCAACESVCEPQSPCSGINIKPRPINDPLPIAASSRTCPYPSCPRYISGEPFAKRYRLERHLKTAHAHERSPPAPSDIASPRALSLRPKTDRERTLSCPIEDCPQRNYVYARSTRLYDHIRHAHPEFDLDEYKKVAAKGKRGKYDRSRSRPRIRKDDQEHIDEDAGTDDGHSEVAQQRNDSDDEPDSADEGYED